MSDTTVDGRLAALERSVRRWQLASLAFVVLAVTTWSLATFGEKRFKELTVETLRVEAGNGYSTTIYDQGVFVRTPDAIGATLHLGDAGGVLSLNGPQIALTRNGLTMPGIWVHSGDEPTVWVTKGPRKVEVGAGYVRVKAEGGVCQVDAQASRPGVRLEYAEGGTAQWPE